jgi:1,4-dihydroxy-2-naphthoyl-CoA hydrolase
MTQPSAARLRLVPDDERASLVSSRHRSGLPGLLGIELVSVEAGRAEAHLALRDELMLSAGEPLHAGTVLTLADSSCGWGCLASLPEGIAGFTTAEVKANLIATTRAGDTLVAVATMVHGGRTTQVWDSTVTRASDGRAIAHFRCTQYLLAQAR